MAVLENTTGDELELRVELFARRFGDLDRRAQELAVDIDAAVVNLGVELPEGLLDVAQESNPPIEFALDGNVLDSSLELLAVLVVIMPKDRRGILALARFARLGHRQHGVPAGIILLRSQFQCLRSALQRGRERVRQAGTTGKQYRGAMTCCSTRRSN